MKKIIYDFLLAMVVMCACGMSLQGCKEDEYTSRGDLFQPRFAQDPVVEGNTIKLVWYQVNNAKSYTVQVFTDNYYTNLFSETVVTDPSVVIDDIPYATTYYIKVRCNAAEDVHNSQWANTSATTEKRPEYAEIVQDVSKTEITESSAVIRWTVDPANPVDSICVAPKMDKTIESVTRYLTDDEKAKGCAEIDGLTKNTLYTVNLYDTSKPRKYDKPYNEVTFRTAGPAAQSIIIGVTDDLSAILADNNEDPEIPEGTEYYLPAGSTYTISTFGIKKGFRIVGATGENKAKIIVNGSWKFESGAYIQSIEFQNVEVQNAATGQYFFNCGNPFTLESASFVNVDFVNIMRGFWRHQGENKKHIMSMEFEGCRFDKCGWQTGSYGTFAFGSAAKNSVASNDEIDRLVIKNCTFSRGGYQENTGFGWGNLVNMSTSDCPIHLEIKNVTFYDFCVNNRLIDLTNAAGSELIMEGVVMASPAGELYRMGTGTTKFANNYTTTDYKLGGSKMNATDLDVSAADLFADPANGDYTIKDTSSPIYTNRAGDTRWIK